MRARRPLPALAAALLSLLAPARAEWVEISQSHYRKPLKPAGFTTQFTEPTNQTKTLSQSWGTGHVYRADLDPDSTFNDQTSKKINPFLSRPSVNKKPNRVDIRRPSEHVDKRVEDDNVGKNHTEPEVKRKTDKTPNRLVFLDRNKAHTGVNKPVMQASDEVGINYSAQVSTSSGEYGSSVGSSEKRNKFKVKGKVEPIAKPEKISHLPNKNVNSKSAEVIKVIKDKTANELPTKDIQVQYADSISNVKLVFQPDKSLEKRVPNLGHINKIQRIKKPNRIYVNTLNHESRPFEKYKLGTSTETLIDLKQYSSTESEPVKIKNSSTHNNKQQIKSEAHQDKVVERPEEQSTSKPDVTRTTDLSAQLDDNSNSALNNNNFKRLDVSNLDDLRDPEFVTKYETFEIDDDVKYPDVIVEIDNSQEPYVGGANVDIESNKSNEEPTSSVVQNSNENLNIPETNDPISNETKPNPLENVVKLMRTVADTITKNTRHSFKSKINYLESLRDTIMSNIKERIDATWPDDEPPPARGARRARGARGHVEFPSSEGALMTISFLTFAVFLIKLVLQVISTYKNKAMMVSPAVFAVSRAAAALRDRNNNK